MKNLDIGLVKTLISDIEFVFKQLQQHFDISMPHYRDYFEQSGETLLKYTDEFTESMHSQLRQFEESHHYKNLKFECETHAQAQHKSIVHINSLNID